jgi:hypothetical protein
MDEGSNGGIVPLLGNHIPFVYQAWLETLQILYVGGDQCTLVSTIQLQMIRSPKKILE